MLARYVLSSDSVSIWTKQRPWQMNVNKEQWRNGNLQGQTEVYAEGNRRAAGLLNVQRMK